MHYLDELAMRAMREAEARAQRDLPEDDRELARNYRLLADQGNADAQVNLGVFYRDGRGGLRKDDRRAADLFKEVRRSTQCRRRGQPRLLLRERPRRPRKKRRRGGTSLHARRYSGE